MSAIVLCTINAKWIHPSLALRLLKANLPDNLDCCSLRDSCTILEFSQRQSLAEKTAAVLAKQPEIFALSVSIWNHQATLELLRDLENEWPEKKPVIVLGGPELTPLPPETEIFNYADFVIRGEGELIFAQLCRAVSEDLITAKKTYGKFIEGGEADLNIVKNAYNLYTEEDLEHKLIYAESSRGCPYSCAFCQSAANVSLREFPLESFFNDFDRLLQRCRGKIKTIKFLDRSFNIKLTRAVKILEFCLLKTEHYSVQFHFEMIPAVFPEELCNILALFPPETIRLEIGIQSFNAKTNALIHRISNPEKELEVLRFLREKTNAILHVDLIAGLPGEDIGSFGNGFDRLWITLSGAGSSAPFEIQLGILKCLPGTPIYDKAIKDHFSIVHNTVAPYEVTETDCLPASDMEKIKNFARFWEQIVNRRSFPDLLSRLTIPGEAVFARFMDVSQKLLDRFGRNWGIPKPELEDALKTIINQI